LGQGDWTASLKATMNAAPYSLVFAYEIGWDGIMANRPGIVIEELSKLKPDLLHFPGSYWENITLAYHMLGNHQKELEMARKGREKYPENRYLLYYEMRALAALGKMEIINQRLNESFAMPQDDHMHSGWLMLYTSRELRAHGYFNEATGMAERCVEWCKLNHPADETEVIGAAYYVAEKWDKAQENFEWLLNAHPEDFSTWGNLGVIAARKGDTLEVKRIRKHITEMKRPHLFGKDLYWLAKIAAVSGEKEKAVQLYHEAMANGVDIYYIQFILPGESMDFESLRDYPSFQELIRPKG
jgi:tetratricopeptide (TPR) repeat protein